jgi:hypothetical protein
MSQMLDSRVHAASSSLEAASQALLGFLASLPMEITTEPLVGGWTPAGHVWHVALTNDVFAGVLRGDGPISPEAGRSDFTDAQWTFNSPPPVAAPGILIPPAEAVAAEAAKRLRESVVRLRALIEGLDRARGVDTVQLPWGRITVYQMTEWAAGHTLRHLAQVGRELHRSSLRALAA